MTIFIGGAWPYANGSLHLGHIASLLPGDILARYYRAAGEEVLYVSGSDCHGTPIAIRADKEGRTPEEVAGQYHEEFADCFRQLGFSYDLYTRTDSAEHHRLVQELFLQLLASGMLELKTVAQTYCPACSKFLPDRYVEGRCPRCHEPARGDQCEACSTVLDATELLERVCKLCGATPETRMTEHYFLRLSALQQELSAYATDAIGWRDNAVQLTHRYLEEGLVDRAATRDLPWGIDVPLPDFTGKKIYVWIEAVSGYYTASRQWAEETGRDWKPFWNADADTLAYYVHGKDNIPFHSLILPAILMGIGGLRLPDRIVASEYLTLEGKKISTSRNWAIWVPDVLKRYHPDSLRYFLAVNAPEKHDGDFSWREFIHSHNGELLGAYGNFVNRNLAFIVKAFDGKVPDGQMNPDIQAELTSLYSETGRLIAATEFKRALEQVFAYVRRANQYFDAEQPWRTALAEPSRARDTLFTCVQMIANLAQLLSPYLPFSSAEIRGFLGQPPLPDQADHTNTAAWQYCVIAAGTPLHSPKPLFARIDPKQIVEELDRLTRSNATT
jgi:methionyl-tRNA synthetase